MSLSLIIISQSPELLTYSGKRKAGMGVAEVKAGLGGSLKLSGRIVLI